MSPEELLRAWGDAWSRRGSADQAELLRAICTEDVEFVPPDDRPVVRGIDALIEQVGPYTAQWPEGVRFDLASPVTTHHDWSRAVVEWTFPTATAYGTDIIRVVDGRIAMMLVFAEASAPR